MIIADIFNTFHIKIMMPCSRFDRVEYFKIIFLQKFLN